MCDGDRAYIDGYMAILPIEVGETKNFIFRIFHDWASINMGASIWGITVKRHKNGVIFSPFDPGIRYVCQGHWGAEVIKEVIK